MTFAIEATAWGHGISCPRRTVLASALGMALAGCAPRLNIGPPDLPPAVRVILDNDFGGDPDGLFLLAHLMLSRSVELPLVVGSQYRDFGEAELITDKAQASVRKAMDVLRYFPERQHPPLVAGRNGPLSAASDGSSPASAAIVRAILADGFDAPQFYVAGGSLTELALAWRMEPAIGRRITLVWIGGAEHADLASPPPGPIEPEYNFSLDPVAARIVFNESDIPIWQIPRNAFRQMLVSMTELEELAASGPLGRYLHQQVATTERRLAANLPAHIFSPGETYMLGDTALVTLTALRTPFQADAASSGYVARPTPVLHADGSYSANPAGRPMRVYSLIDADLTWRDFAAKLRLRR